MTLTPETAVKAEIKRNLEALRIPYLQPVQFGYGKRAVDFYATLRPQGRALLIETKRFKAKLRPFQKAILDANAAAGGVSVYAATCWADVEAAIKAAGTPLIYPLKDVREYLLCSMTRPGG